MANAMANLLQRNLCGHCGEYDEEVGATHGKKEEKSAESR